MALDHFAHRLERMEGKLDDMSNALAMLARIDERMLYHIEEAKRMAERQEKIEARVRNLELLRARLLGVVAVLSSVGSIVGPYIFKLIKG